jgi:hypothetical protein
MTGAGRFLPLLVVFTLLVGGFGVLTLGLALGVWLLGLVVFKPCASALFGISNKGIDTKDPLLSLAFKKDFILSLNSLNNFFSCFSSCSIRRFFSS